MALYRRGAGHQTLGEESPRTMKKQIIVTLATLLASGVIIATIIPLIKPAGAGSDVATSLVLKLFPLGIVATIAAFFLSKPKSAADHSANDRQR